MKKTFSLFATLFYFFIFVFSFIVFYYLSLNWYFPYRILLIVIPIILIYLLIYFIQVIPIAKIDHFLQRKKILRILLFFIIIGLLFFILYFYHLPDYYFYVLLIISIFFWLTRYYILYGLTIILLVGIFSVYQIYYFEQELLLSYLESKQKENLQKEILEQLEIQKNQNKIYIKDKLQDSFFNIKLPEDFEEIQNENALEFPLIYIGKPKNQELPIFSLFLIKKNYPLYLLDLRIESLLTQLKRLERIESYKKFNNPYLESLLKRSTLNQFYQFYDRFYAANIQIGYYALSFNEYYIILWVREIQKPGFPHDPYILEIINSIERK
ncbi:MAG: hypothetical protein KatS3mg129_1347 [Leptospiraceae bacterium]|nr:MAG: hypothetical protein KatS3mg129_1347 [Leptospiraceae bacterium]